MVRMVVHLQDINVMHCGAGIIRELPVHSKYMTFPTLSIVTQEYADKALLKDPESIAAFVELHIEQGPHLEAEKKNIGIVEAIMAPALLRIEFTGRGGHGGGAPGIPSCEPAVLSLCLTRCAGNPCCADTEGPAHLAVTAARNTC